MTANMQQQQANLTNFEATTHFVLYYDQTVTQQSFVLDLANGLEAAWTSSDKTTSTTW